MLMESCVVLARYQGFRFNKDTWVYSRVSYEM